MQSFSAAGHYEFERSEHPVGERAITRIAVSKEETSRRGSEKRFLLTTYEMESLENLGASEKPLGGENDTRLSREGEFERAASPLCQSLERRMSERR